MGDILYPPAAQDSNLVCGKGGIGEPSGVGVAREPPPPPPPPPARTSGREGVRAGPGTIIRDKILMKWVAINAPELPGTPFCIEFRAGSFWRGPGLRIATF